MYLPEEQSGRVLAQPGLKWKKY